MQVRVCENKFLLGIRNEACVKDADLSSLLKTKIRGKVAGAIDAQLLVNHRAVNACGQQSYLSGYEDDLLSEGIIVVIRNAADEDSVKMESICPMKAL